MLIIINEGVNMDKINLGKITLPRNWDEVDLNMWEKYMRATDEDGKISVQDTICAFSDIDKDTLDVMPYKVLSLLMDKLSFLKEDIGEVKEDNKIEINGELYYINYMADLTVKEYLDTTNILLNDNYDYSNLLAVLCRKDGEQYDDTFISQKLESRYDMFNKLEVKRVLPLIGFFLTLHERYVQHLISSSMVQEIKDEGTRLVRNIESSLKLTDYIIPSRVRWIMTLRKLKKCLSQI